jgi:hypothetical protein
MFPLHFPTVLQSGDTENDVVIGGGFLVLKTFRQRVCKRCGLLFRPFQEMKFVGCACQVGVCHRIEINLEVGYRSG